MKNEPKLTLVGAGPGDPELITMKGLKALGTANVVLYDALSHPDLLDHTPAKALRVFVGKRAGRHSIKQEEIDRLIVNYALQYGHVVRLKGGDPFVFGRGQEEIAHAQAFGIATEVIPGITSAVGVPALQGIPVTRREDSESFWVITGTTRERQLSSDIELAARSTATVVVLMGMGKLQRILDIYEREGRDDLPVAIIQNGSLPNEQVAIGTVNTIAEEVTRKGMGAPAIIVLGEVVKRHADFNHAFIQKTYLRA